MTEASCVSRKWDWLASVATALSIVACYGTLLTISALSLLGVSLAVHTRLWAGAIVFFALLSVVGIWLGYRRHRAPMPLLLAAAGVALIVWVMFGAFNRLLELAGFSALLLAVAWDWRLKRRAVLNRDAVNPR